MRGCNYARQVQTILIRNKHLSGQVMALRSRSRGANVNFLMLLYAPHSGHGTDLKEAFYESVESVEKLLTECAEAEG